MERYQEKGVRLLFRADAALAKPEVYEYLEERRVLYAIRLPRNDVAAMGDCPSAEEAGGKAAQQAYHLVRRLLVSGG